MGGGREWTLVDGEMVDGIDEILNFGFWILNWKRRGNRIEEILNFGCWIDE
jgi:hypothetical protein